MGSNNYVSTILADLPLAYYRLNELSGTSANDSSGNNQTGTTHGSPTLGVTSLLVDTPDLTDKAMTFAKASSQYISLPTTFTPTGALPWSLECWTRITVSPTTGFASMVAFGTNTLLHSAAIKIQGGTPAVFLCSGFNADITGGTALINTTYHVVGTYDGTSTRLYVNGVLVAGPTAYALNVIAGFTNIAQSSLTLSEYFDGTIDEVAIYGTALSAAQVAAHYLAGRSIFKTLGVRARIQGKTTQTLGVRALIRVAPKVLGVRFKLSTTPQVIATIGNNRVAFREDSWILHQLADERQRAQFTVLDYPGVASYARSQQVSLIDPTLGTLFSGVVIEDTQDKANTYPDPTIEHQIDTVDNAYFADKRTSNRQYTTPTYAGKIALDTVIDVLGTEGILAPYAQRIDTTQNDWSNGTLSSCSATSNVGDGNLELQDNGISVYASYATAVDWNTGTLINTTVNAGGDLSLSGVTRNWNNLDKTGQTLYGPGSPTDGITNGQYVLRCNAASETRSRLDFAGLWLNGVIEVDLVIGPNRRSFSWRTTNWTNIDSTYAYVVEVTQTYIEIHRGSNGGANLNVILGRFTFAQQIAPGTYRLRVVVNGTTFTASLNGVQYLSVSDGTYTAPGYIALRNRNESAATLNMIYDNFGVVASLSGTWQSAAVSINSVNLVSTSIVTWDQSLSTGGTILVQTSIDAGASWQTASNGGFIPLLAPGAVGTGKTVMVKVTLSNTTTATLPDIKSLKWSVIGGYLASGTRVSPLLSLTPAGVIGSTLVAWNAVLPSAATTLGVDTSIDNGVTWTDVTQQNGGPIPGFNTQPEPTVDSFTADTSLNYTNTFMSGGGPSSWTMDLANRRIVASTGSYAMYLANALSVANVDVLCDMDRSDAGGLVWDVVDTNNYYALSAADNGASVGTKSLLTLTKTVAGVPTTLATGAIVWQRGVYKRLRATTNAGIISCFFDGALIFSYTDGSPLGAGQVGLYQTGSGIATSAGYGLRSFGPPSPNPVGALTSTSSRFYLFWAQPLGDSAIGKTVMTRCRLATTDSTVTPQVLDLTVLAYTPNIGVGTLIPSADYRQVFMSKILDDLAKQSNYLWYIDPYKALRFIHRSTMPSPWILQSSSIASVVDLVVDNLAVTVANNLFRNRQTLKNVNYTGPYTGNFQGDGQATSFTLTNAVAPGTVPVITLNGTVQKVGKKGTTGSQWYYAEGDLVLAQNTTMPVLVSTDRLVVLYTGIYLGTVTVDNTSSQAQLALIEGGSGIVEAVEDVAGKNMFVAAALVYAQQLLVRYCLTGRTVTFTTYRNGLAVGQILNVFVMEEGIFNVQMLIVSIDATFKTQPNNTILYKYVVSCSELSNLGSWAKLLATGIF